MNDTVCVKPKKTSFMLIPLVGTSVVCVLKIGLLHFPYKTFFSLLLHQIWLQMIHVYTTHVFVENGFSYLHLNLA